MWFAHTVWVWAAGSEATPEQIDEIILLLARRVQVPASSITEAQRCVQINVRVNGAVALATNDDVARKIFALPEVQESGAVVFSPDEGEKMCLDEGASQLVVARTDSGQRREGGGEADGDDAPRCIRRRIE